MDVYMAIALAELGLYLALILLVLIGAWWAHTLATGRVVQNRADWENHRQYLYSQEADGVELHQDSVEFFRLDDLAGE